MQMFKNLILNQEKTIIACIKNKSWAQKELFDFYNKSMFSVAYRYTSNTEDSEDVLTDSFISVFKNLKTFKIINEKSLENWIKTIVINNALMLLRKRKRKRIISLKNEEIKEQEYCIDEDFKSENIFFAINNLPNGYKTIFNMYIIDGYSHKEIADELQISVQTSKSQLSRAKKSLQLTLKEFQYERYRI